MLESLLQKITGWLRPGHLVPGILVVREDRTLDIRASSAILHLQGNCNLLIEEKYTISPGTRIPLGTGNDRNTQLCKWKVQFITEGVAMPAPKLVIITNNFTENC